MTRCSWPPRVLEGKRLSAWIAGQSERSTSGIQTGRALHVFKINEPKTETKRVKEETTRTSQRHNETSLNHFEDLLVERDGAAASIPQLSCPGLISRSQSAISEEVQSGASFAMERPTLLTAKAGKPTCGHQLCAFLFGRL